MAEGENFVDFYMRQMDLRIANTHIISDEAFVPGNYEDIVNPSGNKKVDLSEYLTKVLKKESMYRIKTDYVAHRTARRSDTSSGGTLINITINRVYVFHKTLKEIEEFYRKL